MGNRLLFASFLGISLAAAGCEEEKAPAPERVANVAVAVVAPAPMADRLAVRATLEPWKTVRLSAEIPGRLVHAARDRGDPVTRGERLFELDTASLVARVHAAEATARYDRLNYERSLRLYDDNALSKDALDKALADTKVSEAAVEVAKAELAKAAISAPMDGVLDSKLAEVGEFLNPGSPLGDVVDISRVKVIIPVPEKDIVHVRLAEKMAVVVDALGPAEMAGQVIFVKQVADPATLTFPVHIALDNADGRMRAGMIARVVLVRRRVDQAIAVPLFSIIRLEQGYQVFVEEGGVARSRHVKLGMFDADRVEVVEGLRAGDRLIVEGHRNLSDGDAVHVVRVLEAGTSARPAPVGEAAAAGQGPPPSGGRGP